MALKHHYDEYLEELASQGLDPNGDPIRPHPQDLSDRELKDRLMDKIKEQIERHELDAKAQGIPEATKDLPPGPPKELKDFLEDRETEWHQDKISEHRRKWLEEATKADANTPREQLEKLYARDPEIPPSDPEALQKAGDQWKREWNLNSPKTDPNETLEDLSANGDAGSGNTPEPEMLDDIEQRLGGGKGTPGPKDAPASTDTPPSTDSPGSSDAPPTPGDGLPGGKRTWEKGTDTVKPGDDVNPPTTVGPSEPPVDPPVDDDLPLDDPPIGEPPAPEPPVVEPTPPEPPVVEPTPPAPEPPVVEPTPPPAPPGVDQGAQTDPNIQVPGSHPPSPPSVPTPPAAPPAPGSGPSLPNIPLAPLAPVIVAGGTEVVKAAGKGIIWKVIGGIIVIIVLIGGTKIAVDQFSGSGKPKTPATRAPAGGGGPFNGVYAVSERDRGGVCPDGTSFRSTLAQGQPGPTFNYNVRVVSDSSSVSFGPAEGGTILTAEPGGGRLVQGRQPGGQRVPGNRQLRRRVRSGRLLHDGLDGALRRRLVHHRHVRPVDEYLKPSKATE